MALPKLLNSYDLQPFLANPALLTEQTIEQQLAIANYPDTPTNLLEILVNSSDPLVAEAASHHVNWAGEITENWQQIADTTLQTKELRQNDHLAVELLKIAPVADYFLSEWVPASYLSLALKNPHLPLRYRVKYLERLAQEPDLEPRLEVAECRKTPVPMLEVLAGDLELPIRMAVKSNPITPVELIELMEEQLAVAKDWNTDSEQLATLGESRWDLIRLAVAQNPATSGETLMQLAEDGVFKIKLAVAKNPHTPANILAVLMENSREKIKLAVARHPHATEEMLHQLFPSQKGVLERRKNLPANILERFFREAATDEPIWKQRELRSLLLKQLNTPSWILAELANVDIEAVRAEKKALKPRKSEVLETWVRDEIRFLADVAKHPQVSVEILERLSDYPYSEIQMAIGHNPQTPESLRNKVAKYFKVDVAILRSIANEPLETKIAISRAKNKILDSPSLSPLESYRLLLEKEQQEEMAKADRFISTRLRRRTSLADTIKSSASGTDSGTNHHNLYSAARNSRTPIHLLEQLAKHPDERVRSALLDNRSLPSNIMLELACDSSVSVRSKLTRKDRYRQTPVEILEMLADDESEKVRELVAENPDTPVEGLVKLANDSSENVKKKLVSNPNTPVEILERFGLEEGIFDVRNPNTPSSVLEKAVRKLWEGKKLGAWNIRNILSNLLKNPVKGSQMPANILDELSHQTYSGILRLVASHPNTSSQTLDKLSKNKNSEVRTEVAKHPNTSSQTLDKLCTDDRSFVRTKVAENPNTSSQTLEKLYEDSEYLVRAAVAENPNTPPQVLEKIARYEDPNEKYRSYSIDKLKTYHKDRAYYTVISPIAKRQDTPATALEFLANSPETNIRKIVAKNPNTPSTALESLATTESDTEVLTALNSNPNLTTGTLQRLSGNSNHDFLIYMIRSRRELSPELWQKLAEDENAIVREAIASSSNTPINILEALALDTNRDVRRKIAANPNTPTTSLEILSQDSIYDVRIAVASNQNTNVIVLEQLAQDKKVEVRRAVAQNRSTPAPLQESLEDLLGLPYVRQPSTTLSGVSRIYKPDTDDLPTLLSEYAQSDNAFVRFVSLMHPLTPVDGITEGCQSLFWQERYAVAENPSTPGEIREQLANDSNRIVRATAKANL
ncbi:MAG: hypothetical protein SWX82_33205 [Cyanobacteriota bacterium]|nr:hypothetical protein [Cyanobacteriota bacterium]